MVLELCLGKFANSNKTRLPEALKPGKFDIFGCSHQIFHLLVVLATVIHMVAILSAYDYNYTYRRCVGHLEASSL